MYITCIKRKGRNGKTYTTWLLRRSYRDGKKVKNETVGRLSNCSSEEIGALQQALKKKPINGSSDSYFRTVQGRSIGAAWVISKVAASLGIVDALGDGFNAQLALWLIIARIVAQGSRLSATRLAAIHDIASVIKLSRGFDENDLYGALHWLSDNQVQIEDRLFKRTTSRYYWYDVTSTYLEGEQNAFAAFGYNRDQKKRKRQIVVGLLCQQEGTPVSIEPFNGNTQDSETVQSQLIKLTQRFKCENIVLVGDRGMIRHKQMEKLKELKFNYITALTLPQVKVLFDQGLIKLEDFSNEIKSISYKGVRYIFRRNPELAKKKTRDRNERLLTVKKHLDRENHHLQTKPKTSAPKAKDRMVKYAKKLCIHEWVTVRRKCRQLYLQSNPDKLAKKSEFDGCYVWTTDLPTEDASDIEVYERYKDLKFIEDAFRDLKTTFLEVRPVFVRTLKSTRGHLLVMMLSYMILKELKKAWNKLEVTVEEGLAKLSTICQNTLEFTSGVKVLSIPHPCVDCQKLLTALGLELPRTLDEINVPVVTRKKSRTSA